jgi:predicted nucleic acid-binding protein
LTTYADTSVLITALTDEARAKEVFVWLESPAARLGGIMISDWTITEVSSALSLKVRVGAIDEARRVAAIALFERMIDESLVVAPIAHSTFRAAARLAGQPGLALRAGDALHLAVAVEQGVAVCTLDRAMATAAASLGVKLDGPSA